MIPSTTYLDYAASAPLEEEVLQAMLPFLREVHGNPSSVHSAGRSARHALEQARSETAELLGATPEEVIFTSGGTEADFLALEGFLGGGGFVSCLAEHEAVLQPLRRLEGSGSRVVWLVPDESGRPRSAEVAERTSRDSLGSFMTVNNELGTITDVSALADIVHSGGGWIHTDAVQAPACMDMDVSSAAVDMMTLSGHKIGGPRGVGMLYVRSGTPWSTPVGGGGQERGRRGGTENVASIVGFAAALRRRRTLADAERARLRRLAARLRSGLQAELGSSLHFNSPEQGGAPHILNVGIHGISPQQGGEMLILGLDLEGVQVSAGSACASGALTASHVLRAIGADARPAIRYSLGPGTLEAHVDHAIAATARAVGRVRLMN